MAEKLEGDPDSFDDFFLNKFYIAFAIFALIFGSISYCNKQSDPDTRSYSDEEVANAMQKSITTDAVTYHYQKREVYKKRSQGGSYMGDFVDYTFFVGEEAFTYQRFELKIDYSEIERFKKPQLCRVVYAKDNPRIHKIYVQNRPDTIITPALKFFIYSRFHVVRKNGIDEIGASSFAY